MVRWLIKADGNVVDVEYNSEKNAWVKANQYKYRCLTQEDSWAPKMTVEKEEINDTF